MPSQGLSGEESANLMFSEFQGGFSFSDVSYILGNKQWCVVMHMFFSTPKNWTKQKPNKAKQPKQKYLAS